MNGSDVATVSLYQLPAPLGRPMVVTSWHWGIHRFTLSTEDKSNKVIDISYQFPIPVLKALEVWCQAEFQFPVIEYLEKMFGDQYK